MSKLYMAGQKQQKSDYFVHCETNTKFYFVNIEFKKDFKPLYPLEVFGNYTCISCVLLNL